MGRKILATKTVFTILVFDHISSPNTPHAAICTMSNFISNLPLASLIVVFICWGCLKIISKYQDNAWDEDFSQYKYEWEEEDDDFYNSHVRRSFWLCRLFSAIWSILHAHFDCLWEAMSWLFLDVLVRYNQPLQGSS